MMVSLASWVSSPSSSSLFFSRRERLHLIKATSDGRNQIVPPAKDQIPNKEVTESVNVLKTAAKTRKVAADEILAAFSAIEKAKIDPSTFLETLGGTESPGRTWMLIFTAEKKLKKGRYFPLTAVQRFDAATGQIVAIKKIRLCKQREGVNITALREIKMLKELKHPHIILLIDAFPHKENLHLVFEFMETDLEAVIRDSNIFLSPADIKSYLLMTFKGLAYCHEKWVLHRDMKPNNLLIGVDGQLKLADFGLARIFGSPNRKFTHQVFARWYRAPELLFGAKQYGAAVDVWAAGCIFAELLLRRPFLQGNSDIDQLSKIFAAFGTPKADQWPEVTNLPDYVEYQFVPAPSLRSLFPAVSDDALDLLSKMFTYDPKARISIKQALEHRYFTSSPAPTDPARLPKPVRKQDGKSSYGKHEAITVLSPPRKLRRVMHERGRIDSLKSHVDKDQQAPMSLDFTVLAERPPNRPTITSADRSHLKRKLDLEFQ